MMLPPAQEVPELQTAGKISVFPLLPIVFLNSLLLLEEGYTLEVPCSHPVFVSLAGQRTWTAC